MAKEFGPRDYNNQDGYSNNLKETENPSVKNNPSAGEFHDYSVQRDPVIKKSSRGHKIFRSITTVAVTAAAAVVVLPNVLSSPPDVSFDYLHATDTVLEYVISFENLSDDGDVDILVVTPNGVTVSEQPVEDEIVSGTVTNLTAGTRYNIVVKDGDISIASRAVTMATKLVTSLNYVEHECKCAIDGYFHFRVDFVDENGYWSQFIATLTDEYGVTSECDFSDDPIAEHTLSVNGAGMRGNRATLKIVCQTSEPDGDGVSPREGVRLYRRGGGHRPLRPQAAA